MKKYKIGQTVYQQGTFDIFKCKILEYLPNHHLFEYDSGDGEVGNHFHELIVDCYKVQYEDGDTSVVVAGDLYPNMKNMYYV